MHLTSLHKPRDYQGKDGHDGNKAGLDSVPPMDNGNDGLEVYVPAYMKAGLEVVPTSNTKVSRDSPIYQLQESRLTAPPKPAVSRDTDNDLPIYHPQEPSLASLKPVDPQDGDSNLPEVAQSGRHSQSEFAQASLPQVYKRPSSGVPPNTGSMLRPAPARPDSNPYRRVNPSLPERPRPTTLDWDFKLPIIEPEPGSNFSLDDAMSKAFSIRGLISSMQNGVKRGKLQHYLSFRSEALVAQHMNMTVTGFPAIFYAVATNDDKIVRMWIDNGGDPNATDAKYGIPLLGFAILMADVLGVHTTTVTVTLLSLGADVSVMPSIFFSPYIEDPPTKAPFNQKEFNDPAKQWCTEYMRPMLARAVNLTQRYFLEKMAREKRPSERQMQVAVVHNATALLGISYFLIGQSSAAKTVTQKLLSHMALPRSKPLVMVFSGMSFLLYTFNVYANA